MIEIRLAAKIVHLVLFDGKVYVDAIDEVFPGERKSFQSSNISVVLAKQALKHYFLFENIINENKIELSNRERSLLYIVLTNNFYLKILSKNTCNHFLEVEINKAAFSKIQNVLKHKGELEDLISFDKDSNFYLATKYNVPIWLVHMWRKHYGDEFTEDFLKSSINNELQSYVVNTMKTTTEEILKKYPDFSIPFPEMLLYKGTKRFETTEDYKNYNYVDTRIGYKAIIDTIYDPYKELFIYSGYDDDFVKTALIKSGGKQGIHLCVPKKDDRSELMRFIRMNSMRNVNFFDATDTYGLRAGVSYKQDLVVVFPFSTRFDIASKYPDFLLHFDKDTLDDIIKGEKYALELCSTHVEKGGLLIYLVNTLNKKESSRLIEEFLGFHPEYSLEREEQLIGSHPFGSTLYYAEMRRSDDDED